MVEAGATTARAAVPAVVVVVVVAVAVVVVVVVAVVVAVVLAAASSLASSFALSSIQPLPRQNVPAGAFLFKNWHDGQIALHKITMKAIEENGLRLGGVT
ncbi:hypothetical protein AN963_15740 [Brevibacillus choshinensis]|uniref:Uncharacterized protein n=1 Tax=Brevibacillus choshinensis TaxID=54911 RepID=A0ABR5N725_BRECH|nr:hypothetical protein AN963_15740 [Brevibacillus choshinensis]